MATFTTLGREAGRKFGEKLIYDTLATGTKVYGVGIGLGALTGYVADTAADATARWAHKMIVGSK